MSDSTPHELKRAASINYGLEKLNIEIKKPFQQADGSIYLNHDIPGMEVLNKFISFNASSFDFKWSSIIFFVNIYNCFTVAYFLGFSGYPSGFWFALEMASEVILLADIAIRMVLRNTENYKHMWFLHEKCSYSLSSCMLLSSVPYSMICLGYSYRLDHWVVSLIRLPKFLRIFQFRTYLTNLKITLRSKGWEFLDFFTFFLMLMITTHFVAMFMMMMERIERENDVYNHLTGYWENKGSSRKEMFMDIEFWALGSLASITISDIIPMTRFEKMIAVFYIVIGTSVLGAVFVKLVDLLGKKNTKQIMSKQKIETAKNWVKIRKLSDELRIRVLNFYNIAENKFSDVFFQYGYLDELPLSLKTEISLHLHQDLIPKVKLFELGDPAFMMGIVRHLKPKIFMAEDYIVRRGDYAEDFYFIRVGSVEVLASDDQTAICILEEGAYFGEIGILLGVCRTASVRAIIATLISYINRDILISILKNFPEHLSFLKKVAEQRLKTTNKDDIDTNYDLLEEESESDSMSSDESEEQYYTAAEHKNKNCIEKLITVRQSKAIPRAYQIDPFSYFYYIWSFLIIMCYVFYLFYLTYALAFKSEGSWLLGAFDFMSYAIFIVDIFITMNTSILTEFGNYIHDDQEIRKNYFDNFIMSDMIAIIPSDFISKAIGLPIYVTIISKSIRLFKYPKIKSLSTTIIKYSEFSLSLIKIVIYAPIMVFMAHASACLFFIICKFQYEYYQYYDKSKPSFFTAFKEKTGHDFLDKEPNEQYIEFLYFSSSIASSNTYNIIIPVTVIEELFCFFMLILSRLLLAFLLAESSSLIGILHKPYTDQMAKISLIKEWMSQYKLSESLRNRILNHYTLAWTKLKGVEDEEIIKDLPDSLQTDLTSYLYSGIIRSGFFPAEEQGAIRSIIKKCRMVMQCKGEELIKEGELGLEMYFILEGEVEIITHDKLVLNILYPGNVFGEMALLTPFPTVRGATVKARTDISLAILSMDDFNFVMNIYPEFAKKVRMQASQREQMNRKLMHSIGVEAARKHKRLSLMVRNSENIDKEEFSERRENLYYPSEITIEVPIRLHHYQLFLRFHRSRWNQIIQFLITLWNVVYMPLLLAFDNGTFSYIPEIISMIIYVIYGVYYVYVLLSFRMYPKEMTSHYFPRHSKIVIYTKLVHHIVLCLPLLFIFKGYMMIPGVKLVVVIIRVSGYIYLLEYFQELKMKLEWFYVLRIIEVLFNFAMISHIFACVFIEIASWSSENWIESYFADKVNHVLRSNINVYALSAHWAFTCLSHASLGDIVAISNIEKLFNSFICIFGAFVYAILFGNVCSLVSEFASKLRSKLLDSYTFVVDFIKKKRVDQAFTRQVDDYFNYLWQSNTTYIDQIIVKQFPLGIMADVQMFRYSSAMDSSVIFKDQDGTINYQIARTLFRLMELQYYLTGDIIIKLGDTTLDMFIILKGEVEVICIKGNQVIATLKNGDHFGEANLLLNTSMRTANVIASKISQIGVLHKECIEKMSAAYPEWLEYMTSLASERVNYLFKTKNSRDANDIIERISQKILTRPSVSKKYTKRAEKLIAPKLIESSKNPNNSRWIWMSFLHLLLIVYSAFAIPVQIAFNYPVEKYLLYIESFVVLESFGFFLITFRYSILLKVKKDAEYKDLLKFFYQNYMLQDVIGFSPFNLVFPLAGITEPIELILLLRMLRLFSVMRIPSLMQKIELHIRGLIRILIPLKSMFFLILLMHWSSCFWFFVVSQQHSSYTWIDAEGLRDQTVASINWVHSIYYITNIATGTGYSDTTPCTVLEIWLTMMFVLIGNILFAVAFGLVASLSSLFKNRINILLEKLHKILKVLRKTKMPPGMVARLEAYYVFNESLLETFGNLDCKVLYNHLPKNIVNKITYECNKHFLKKMPFFQEHEFTEMVERISLHMVPKIYLPNDYIIYKNDVGEEMYFIILGSVDILSPDGTKVIKTLGKGDYVGEVALLFDVKRMCSVIARTLSLLYLLGKKEFQNIIQGYPAALDVMTQESNKRKAEAMVIQENQKRNEVITVEEASSGDTSKEDMERALNLITSLSYYSQQPGDRSMTALTGMNNVKSELVRDSYAIENKQMQLYKRRPHREISREKRYSQESLGKEIVLSNFSKLKMQWFVEI